MKKPFLSILLFCLAFLTAGAEDMQNSSSPRQTISGRVTDILSGTPLEGATVRLLDSKGHTIRCTVSDNTGYYLFERLENGPYSLNISMIGYESAGKENIQPSAKPQAPIALAPLYALLSDVVVTPEVTSVKTRLGQRTVHVGGDLQTSGNASKDLMNNLPSACTDVKGNMTLRGSSNVRYFIDGRPTNVNSMELLNLLPASAIDKVEFITSPSAREYPDGPSGIVNIITTKSKKKGFGASVEAGIGTGDKYNVGINLNRRWEKVNVWAAYTFFQNKSLIAGQVSKTDISGTPASSMQQVGGAYMGKLHEVKAGVDYDISSRTQLAYSTAYRNAWRSSLMNIGSRSFASPSAENPSSAYDSRAYSVSRMDFITNALHLSHAFNSKNRLEVDVNYEIDNTDADTRFAQDFSVKASPYMPDRVVDTSAYKNDYTYFSARADYTLQGDKYKFETGVSANLRTMDNPYRDKNTSVMPSPIPPVTNTVTSHFKFAEDVYAVYATYSRLLGDLTISAGVRGEYWKSLVRALPQAGGEAEKRYVNDSINFFPSANITYHLSDHSSLMLSYSSRVARPDTRQLNPNAVSTNPARPNIGNPYLKPEYNRSVELTYHGGWNKADISLSAYYNYNDDVIQPYLTPVNPVTGQESRGILYNTYKNYGSSYFIGTELIASAKIAGRLDLSGSLNAYYADYSRGENTFWNKSGINFTAKMAANVKVTDHLTAMVLGRYSGKQTLIQGTVDANGTMDAGLRYTLFSGRMNLSARVTDVLNSFCSTTRSVIDAGSGTLQNEISRENYQSRVFYFTASYNF